MNARHSLLLSGLLATAFCWTAATSRAQTTRLIAKPGSTVRIEGTSTVHDWTVAGRLIGGYAEVGPNFPLKAGQDVKPGKVEAQLDAFIPVTSLKSVKDGKPYSAKMDEVTYGKLLKDQYSRITYHLTNLELKELPKNPGDPYVFDSTGELVVAGVTNTISMPVKVTHERGDRIKFAAKTALKMTEFNIEPVKISILGIGAIKTGDEVKLTIEWMTAVAPSKN